MGASPLHGRHGYSAELNIQGKYVYGDNWNLKTFNAGGYTRPAGGA